MRLRLLLRLLAATLVLGALLSVPTESARAGESPSAQDIEQAKKHMRAGVAFMQDPDGPKYEEAYPEFKKAYALSGSLNALQNLAICAQNLELDGEAIELYGKFLEGKGDSVDPKVEEQVRRDKQALEAVVAWVTLSTDKVGVSIEDVRYPRRGSPITNVYEGSIQGLKLGIHPGRHKFTARADGYDDQVWEVTIKNGGAHSHTFSFDPNAPVTAEGFTEEDQQQLGPDEGDEDEGEGGMPVYPWIAAGVTVAVAVPWVIFMAMSSSKKSEYDDALGTAPIGEQEDLKSDLETTNLVADVLMGVTMAGVVTTIILFATADYGGDDEATADRGPRFGVDYAVTPAVDPRGGAGALLTGRF
ncbi:MAG: hypothetical protein JRI23_00620 [Deltaproteobacteria bacterium]|jgi:hypothetical protein|nr:hypothetical protein [Deltaproteobacteria bacterium]MBW2529949.1 hypothetical protein [Deltaproteobacteria bacterium]